MREFSIFNLAYRQAGLRLSINSQCLIIDERLGAQRC